MTQAALSALVVFIVVFVGLLVVEKIIHKLTHNPDRSYRWGVWLFSILAGVYTFLTSLGRP